MPFGYSRPCLTLFSYSGFVFVLGILEFNPQLAGQDITPANLEFGSTASRRRDRREKSFSGASIFYGNQSSLNAIHRSSFTAAPDDLVPLTNQSQTLDAYQSSIEYRLQELTKRLTTLETKLTEDVSSVLMILQRQFPTDSTISLSSSETLKANNY
ncbi:unnamed protein product [Adineta steineri]|uniref:Uncharacterized protein n=1 Tax=Adineta steineri TaxID=433720 RepID=A0A815WFD4_9BILA|nr:unnamed protein product [Adineta steineri]CAF1252668.1 unnamed protein product [Adineta steineri]CAF1348337.1 unnamed protein product [Adineta steineri]CAF1353683.1 unnamed protein product [Adineta steineri]CAF1358891.1 unnamed protein product [Adineta steineri]